jgi:hypothetical protein
LNISEFVTNRMPTQADDAHREPKRQNRVVNTPDSGMSIDHFRAMRKSHV